MALAASACVCLLACVLGAALALDMVERDLDQAPCGRSVFIGRQGFITSHANFGRRLYPRNLECVWRILASPDKRVVAFPTYMSLESARECGFDRLEVIDGLNVTSAERVGVLCGAASNTMFVSSGNVMALRFSSDSTVNKEGFSLRYRLVDASRFPPGARQWNRSDRPCTDSEFRCGDGLCIPQEFTCDRLGDCGDQSDERNCGETGPLSGCGPAEFSCGNGSTCIKNHKRCDGVFDCPGRQDEQGCGEDGVLAPATRAEPYDPSVEPRASCGIAPIKPRIVGGKVARPNSWPWTVSMRYRGSHTCGGSILSSRWILTASHCVEGALNPSSWKIAAGIHREQDSGRRVQVQRVSRIHVHPRWDSNAINYDITLMRLRRPLRWTRYVRPICLPRKRVSSGTSCMIAGWGDTKGTGGSGRLKQGKVKTFSRRQCDRWYGGGITSKMLCAGRREGGVDSCQGDSGGPLMCKDDGRWYVHGATSFGGECGAPNSPGVYANVVSMRSFIKDKTNL